MSSHSNILIKPFRKFLEWFLSLKVEYCIYIYYPERLYFTKIKLSFELGNIRQKEILSIANGRIQTLFLICYHMCLSPFYFGALQDLESPKKNSGADMQKADSMGSEKRS